MQAVLSVGSLVLEARKNAALGASLREQPRQVAQAKNLQPEVTAAAAFALERPETKKGIWY